MTSRLFCTTFFLSCLGLAPVAAVACPAHDQQVMSCAAGAVFDPASNSCKVISS